MNITPTSVVRALPARADYEAAGFAITRAAQMDPTATEFSNVFDVTTLRGRPGGKAGAVDPVVGTRLASLVAGKPDATILHERIGYSGGALRFEAFTIDASQFHETVNFGTVQPRAGLVFFMHFEATGGGIQNGSDNCQLMRVAGLLDIRLHTDANRAVTLFEMSSPNFNAGIPSDALLTAFGRAGVSGGRHALGVSLEAAGAGLYRPVVYLDGVEVFRLSEALAMPATEAQSDVIFGAVDGLLSIEGGLFRFAWHDTADGRSSAAIAAHDYDLLLAA